MSRAAWRNGQRNDRATSPPVKASREVITLCAVIASLDASRMGDGRRARRRALRSSDELGDEVGGAGGALGFHRPVVDRAADLGGDGCGDGVGVAGGVVHAPAGAVAVQVVGDVEVLLEVV